VGEGVKDLKVGRRVAYAVRPQSERAAASAGNASAHALAHSWHTQRPSGVPWAFEKLSLG